MKAPDNEQEILSDLAIRLFTAIHSYTMGIKGMDKIYRELSAREGKINPKLINLASHAMQVWGTMVEKAFPFLTDEESTAIDDKNITN